jgi:hypothetical protein
MQLLLNIYDPQTNRITKQYKAETVDIMFGTIEDLIEIIDVEKLNDNMEWAKVIVLAMKKLKPLLKEVFTGVTDEELKNTKVKELVPLFINILSYMMSEINGLGSGQKN